MPCRCKPCAWCSPLLTQNKTMKKQLLTLALLAVAGTAGAQQLPNVGFEKKWKTTCGQTFQASTNTGGEAATEKKAVGLLTRPGEEPADWNGSNVLQKVFLDGKSDALVKRKNSNERGDYVRLTNSFVGLSTIGVGATAPAYITFGTPWVYACKSESDQDGGTYGGMEFKYRPDAIRGIYKRTNVSGKTEKAHIIAYFWTGTFTSNIGKNHPGKISKSDVDRAIMSKSNAGTITGDGKLIASADYEFTTTTNDDWQEIVVPIVYKDKNTVPAKMNVIISSADYWNRSNIVQVGSEKEDGSILEADDIEFVYYHALSSATYNGQAIAGFAENTLSYDLSSQVYDEKKFDCTVKGIGAEAVKSYNEATGLLTVTVNGNNISDDATSKTVYTFQFKKVDYTGMLSALSVHGKDIEAFAEDSYHYTVVDDYTEGCVKATAKGADDAVTTNYDAATRICSINVVGGTEENTYFVKFAKATTDYKGKMSIAMAGELLSAATSTVGITTPVDGKADFQLLGFELFGGPIGDIFVTDVPYTEKNGVVNLYKEQTITIFGDASKDMELIDLPVVLAGTLKDGKLTAKIDISWNGKPITVNLVPLDATSLDLSSNAVNLGRTPLVGMKADMTNKNLTIFLPEGITGVDAKEKNVVVGTIASSLSLADGNDWGVTKDFTAAAVSYDRVFKTDANYVQSFVLPFGFTVPAGTTVAELSSVNGDNLVFKPVATTEANKPYLVVTTDGEFINKLTNVQVKATTGADLTTTVDGVSHIGSYTAQNVADVYGYANGKFVKANTGSVKPFRTYVKVAGAQAAPMAFGVNIEGTVTGINNATTAATAKEAIYNLQGVRVSGDLKHLTKGVYIVNGQKVVVK